MEFGICKLLMAALFALSACFQFNDSDWYFWIPLYVTACAVNLVDWAKKPNSRLTRFSLWVGLFLFIKVSIEDYTKGPAVAGIWSLDMRDRIARERFGSGLVISSSLLLLLQNSNPHLTQISNYGMPVLVGIAYGVSLIFFAFQHHQMKH